MARRRIEGWGILAVWLGASLPAIASLVFGGHPIFAAFAVAGAVPVFVTLRARSQLRQAYRASCVGLKEQATQLALAERLAGVGRVSLSYPGPHVRWSEEFCLLTGLDPSTTPCEAVLTRLLPQGFAQLETTLDAHAGDTESFVVEFDYQHPDKGTRILRAQAHNQLGEGGERIQVFLIVRDVTEDYRRIAAIEAAKDAAVEQAEMAMKLAQTDTLTGLPNRRAAMAELDRALVAARKSGISLSLIIFDIDRFKLVNDVHGHLVGDRVIRRVAELARRQAGDGGCMARIGGEEFLWLIPACNAETAALAAERLRWAVEAGTALAPIPSVTISLGWAVLEPVDSSLALFGRADNALLEAKRRGRNQVREAA